MSQGEFVFLVQGTSGEWSDRCEWIIGAFYNEKSAQQLVVELGALARAAEDYEFDCEESENFKAWLAKDSRASCDCGGTRYWLEKVKIMDNKG